MANPRRNSYSNTLTHPTTSETTSQQQTQFLSFSYLIYFLKKPHAFPFLLSVFLLLTWVSLRLQVSSSSASQRPHHQHHQSQETQKLKRGYNYDIAEDKDANLVRFTSDFLSSRDKRGWLLNPVNAAHEAGISGGAVSCASTHVGQIRPGAMRGNHRHYTCNETFVIWGAETKFRLENPKVAKGYAEVLIGAEEVAVVASPSGSAHALLNVDSVRTTFFLGCQDNVVTYNTSSTDFNVWKDL